MPKRCKTINCKWILRKKLKLDESIQKIKARLVVICYTQKKGIDYFDTSFPVTKIDTIRTLVAFVVIHGLIAHKMDVKTKFLNRYLEEIYIE